MRRRNRFRNFSLALVLAAALLLCKVNVQAAGIPIPHGTVELVTESQWIEPGHELHVGLHFQLEKGWHIYWRNPGDSGEPPRVTWQAPAGLTPGEMQWPAPRRLGTSSIVDFGYEDAVTLIVPVHADSGLAVQPSVQLGAQIKVLVCREMCIPGKAQVSLTLPIRSQTPAPDDHARELFAAARKSLPQPAPANWKFSVSDAKDSFVLTVNAGREITQVTFFPLAESQIDNAAPQKPVATATGFRLTLRKSDRLLKPIERLNGVLELSANRSYWIDVPLSKTGTAKTSRDLGTHPALS